MRALFFAAALFAAGAAHAEPVTYTLDPAHTQVAFTIERFGFNNVLGRFETVSGEVVLDQANPAASSVHAVIQVGSVDSSNDTRDEHLRGERWLNATQFPTMEFRSTSVRITGENRAEVIGDLTLLGQTHPVTLDVRLNRMGPLPNNQRQAAGFTATGTLQRSAWGSTGAAQLIGNDVSIRIEALAVVPAAAN
ncbi:MAG TPA: YceI family protein [Vitreimonas sp.]|jgi:polyisoprenoid-binding protein YceI|nr:YceI family protein [Vitreimonas sp.]